VPAAYLDTGFAGHLGMPTTTTRTAVAVTPASAGANTGRIVTIISLVVGFIGAAAPLVLDMDFSSTAGVVAGLIALSAVAVKYLDGWQKYEARLDAHAAVALQPAATNGAAQQSHA
jgi:hypothetical protein